MFRWLFKDAVDRGVKRGVDQAVKEFTRSPEFEKKLDDMVSGVLREPEFKFFWFIKAMQHRMMEVDKTLSGKRAWYIARDTYREFLREEKTEFGDPRFDWTKAGARDLIQACEIDYWECRP